MKLSQIRSYQILRRGENRSTRGKNLIVISFKKDGLYLALGSILTWKIVSVFPSTVAKQPSLANDFKMAVHQLTHFGTEEKIQLAHRLFLFFIIPFPFLSVRSARYLRRKFEENQENITRNWCCDCFCNFHSCAI